MRHTTFAACCSAVLLAMGCLPTDLGLFLPTRTNVYDFSATEIPPEAIEHITLQSDGEVAIAALWITQNTIHAHSILFLHGQGGNLNDYQVWAQWFWQQGYNVLMIDYRGYGLSDGTPSEAGFYADARVAWRHMARRTSSTLGKRILWGYSLGSAVASHLAAESPLPMVDVLLLEAPMTSITDMVEGSSPYAIPADWVSSSRFDTLGCVGNIAVPVLIVHGQADRRVPFWMAEQIYAQAKPPKSFIAVPKAGHSNILSLGGDSVQRAVEALLAP